MHRSRSSNTMEAKLKAQTHESDCMRGRKCPMPLIGARERSGRVTGRQPGGMASLLNKPHTHTLSLSLWPAGVIGEGRWLRVPETLAELPWIQVLFPSGITYFPAKRLLLSYVDCGTGFPKYPQSWGKRHDRLLGQACCVGYRQLQ